MSTQPPLDAMLRTTTAVTIVEGGVKENVLPSRASAVVNFRILPGDTIDDVVEHVRRTIDDERIELKAGVRSVPRNPTDRVARRRSGLRAARDDGGGDLPRTSSPCRSSCWAEPTRVTTRW